MHRSLANEVIKLYAMEISQLLSHLLTHKLLKVPLKRLKVDLIRVICCGILKANHLEVGLLQIDSRTVFDDIAEHVDIDLGHVLELRLHRSEEFTQRSRLVLGHRSLKG